MVEDEVYAIIQQSNGAAKADYKAARQIVLARERPADYGFTRAPSRGERVEHDTDWTPAALLAGSCACRDRMCGAGLTISDWFECSYVV